MTARRCTSTDTGRGYCRAYALADSDPPLCHFHSMTPEERKAWTAKGGKARAHAQHLRADREERLEGIAFGVSTEHILSVCRDALDATVLIVDARTHEVKSAPDWGARLSACSILLQVFSKSLRATPEEAQQILHELLDGTRHASLAERAVTEHFKALRREWIETMTRVDALAALYVVAFPPQLFGPGDTASSVRDELPDDMSEWTTEVLKDGSGRLLPYARVTKPDGKTFLVQRDSSIREREAAG